MEDDSSGKSEQQHEETNPASYKIPKKHKSGAQKKREKEARRHFESAKLMRPLEKFSNKDTVILASMWASAMHLSLSLLCEKFFHTQFVRFSTFYNLIISLSS